MPGFRRPDGGARATSGRRPGIAAALTVALLLLSALVFVGLPLTATAAPAGAGEAWSVAAAVAGGPATEGAVAAEAVSWDDRGSLVLSPAEALAALDALPADSPAAVSWSEGGSRTGWFGEAWEDVDGDGCDTRNEILARDLVDTDFSRSPGTQSQSQGTGQGASACPDATVWTGVLHDPYTGRTIDFARGQDTSAAVQIDHVIPLVYLYAHGAWAWDARTRLLVANDPLNLLAVDGEANQDKAGCGPATCPMGSTETGTWDTAGGSGWWPPDAAYRCQYAQRFVAVAAAYRLGLPEEDAASLRQVLLDCSAGGDGTPSAAARVRAAGEVVRSWAEDHLLRRGSTAALAVVLLGAGLLLLGSRGRGRR